MLYFRKNMKQKNNVVKEFSVIVLAAGKSLRMGFPKLSLQYNKSTIFIEKIINEFSDFGCKEIVVVVNNTGNDYLIKHNIQFPKNVKIVLNQHPEWHRFYSLKLGVKALNNIQNTFVHNVDNPFVTTSLLEELVVGLEQAQYIIPEFQKIGGHPILLSEEIIKSIYYTEENQLHLKEFLSQYSKLRITVSDERILANINTPKDYRNNFS